MIKIISLGVGLAMGLVLIAKVFLEQTYDDFFPEAELIYRINSNASAGDSEEREFAQVSGAIAPGMKAEIPEVQVATRWTWIGREVTFFNQDRKKYVGNVVFGDSCLFDIFTRPILAGDPKDILSRPMYAMVSRKIAERMGGESTVIGQTIELNSHPGKVITIGGIFEDIPENSHLSYNVIFSMPSLSQFSYDGTMNWVGNDRYIGYVKLLPGVTPESLAPAVVKMQEKNQPMDELEKAGVKLGYSFSPLLELHKGTPEVKRMFILLSLLAFALIFTAVMNYVLIVISSLVNRSKEIAVNKCYGASNNDIYKKMLSETLVHLLSSLLLAAILIFAFRGLIENLLSASFTILFSWRACLLLLIVCLVVFLMSGLIPGYLYARIPIASAFRNYNENKRFWKLGLLFVQFMATGFLITLLVVIGKQYDYMIKDKPGYAYENLAYVPLSGVNNELRSRAIEEVGRLSEVKTVTTASQLPIGWLSGNNIYLPGDDRELFNIADLYWVGNNYLEMMEIPVIEGHSFTENVVKSSEVMVSRGFVDKITQLVDWPDGVIGKSINITEHSDGENNAFTICGVYENVRLGTMDREDSRPSVMFYSSRPSQLLMIKYHDQTPELNQKVSELLSNLMPDKDIVVYSYPSEMQNAYSDSRKFRDSVMLGGIVALIISLIGLIGYTNDEMNRRRKETAIRKVNGATILNILYLFLKDIARIALPALIIGCSAAAYVGSKWQEQFSDKATLTLVLFMISGLLVLAVILAVVSLNSYRAASANPAESVKSE